MIERLDHVALGVADLDERIAFYTGPLGMELKRVGTHMVSGGRIALVADPRTGVKLELIESPAGPTGLRHLAFRVDDVAADLERLVAAGMEPLQWPQRLEAARAETALLRDPAGMEVQLIKYAPDSPDL